MNPPCIPLGDGGAGGSNTVFSSQEGPFPSPGSVSQRGAAGSSAPSQLVELLVVPGVETVEDSPAEGEDGPAPGQTVAPVELVVDPQVDALDELDGVEDQAAGLEDNWRHRTGSFQSRDVLS